MSATALSLLGLILPAAVLGQVDEELARAAKSPYEIARFVDTHSSFQWEPLWKALGIHGDDVFMQPCEQEGGSKCYEELVTVLDPFQVILLLRHELPGPEVYLRFFRQGGLTDRVPWRFGGYYSPLVKYFEPRHRTFRLGTKPFFAVTQQGVSGSGVSSEIEGWIDLTLPTLKPVLRITSKGYWSSPPEGISMETSGHVVATESAPTERIEVFYSATLTHNEKLLANRSTKATYTRRGRNFAFDADRSNVSEAEVEKIYDVGEATNEDYLRYFLPDLKRVATGKDAELKQWLKEFLEGSKDTTETRELLELLRKPPGLR